MRDYIGWHDEVSVVSQNCALHKHVIAAMLVLEVETSANGKESSTSFPLTSGETS
jgi:hypothetical protein